MPQGVRPPLPDLSWLQYPAWAVALLYLWRIDRRVAWIEGDEPGEDEPPSGAPDRLGCCSEPAGVEAPRRVKLDIEGDLKKTPCTDPLGVLRLEVVRPPEPRA